MKLKNSDNYEWNMKYAIIVGFFWQVEPLFKKVTFVQL